ncbi:MAG: PspC domain-containing protein [Anaerolineaceae bacterium]|nr:PspC domain-containing protein [Anaerolineaceae bacterium]
MNRRLLRSQNNRILGGVCGGIGEYFSVDPIIIRLIFLALLFLVDISFWIYIILWVIIPSETQEVSIDFSERIRGMGDDVRTAVQEPKGNYTIYIGGALVLLGGSLLLKQYIPNVFYYMDKMTLPILLIAAGAFIFYRAIREK